VSDERPLVDPEEELRQWAGDVVGRFALDERSVRYGELVEAVGVSKALSAKTVEELLDPNSAYLVELFCSP
jgi:hypothetical protein